MSLSAPAAALGLALAFALPVSGLYRGPPDADDVDWPLLRRSLLRNWAALAGIVALVAVAGDPADLGLRVPAVGALVDGLLFGFVAFTGTMLAVALVLRATGGVTADAGSLVAFDQPPARRLAIAVTGAVVETTLFFGFAVEAALGLGSGPWVAGAVGAVGLLLVRARWGVRQALQWLPGALVLAGIALATRTLLVVVAVRLGYDVLTLLSGDADDYRTPAGSSDGAE